MSKSLTTGEARVLTSLVMKRKMGITVLDFPTGFRLGARIFDLRVLGYKIITRTEGLRSGARVARYFLIGNAK